MYPEHQGIGPFEKTLSLRTGIALSIHLREEGMEKVFRL
jgi:hypothetical protein